MTSRQSFAIVCSRCLEVFALFSRTLIGEISFCIVVAVYPLFCLLSWLRFLVLKTLKLKPAVLWAPTPILTISESSALLRRLGYPSTTLVYTTYHVTDHFDINVSRLINNRYVGLWLPNFLFLWALLKFDIFHLFYGGGLWSGMGIVPHARRLELPLLRLAGKRIIASAYGGDVRVRELTEQWRPYNICQECPDPGRYCICDSTRAEANASYYRAWCNALLAMGDMHEYVPGSCKEFKYWPIDVQRIPAAGVSSHPGPIRIVHAPNARFFKGTRFIEQAVASLKSKGYDLDLIMVERVSNAEARRKYGEADIVIAQCLIGWIGYTELEAMAAGKPVISYIRDPRYLSHTHGCPIVSANPDTLESALERLIRSHALRDELGRQGRAYVEREWSYEALAPHYDALHHEVWEKNRLGQALLSSLMRVCHGFASRFPFLVRLLNMGRTFIDGAALVVVLLVYPFFCLLSWLRILVRKRLGLKPAVVWGPAPILTIAESSALLRRLGYPSTTIVYASNFISDNYDTDLTPFITIPILGRLLPHGVFLWALLKFDIFHLFYGGGLWSGMGIVPHARRLELPLLRLAGKRIIASAYGGDVRVRELTEQWRPYNICQECPDPGRYCICDSTRAEANASYYRAWCNALLAMGDMHEYVPGSCKEFKYWPIDVQRIPAAGVSSHPGPIRIVHAPNARFFKGTRFIEQAVASLKSKGYDLDLIMVERVSNAEARRKYGEADIVIAQCLIGWIGYTELEAMAAGKPVISYIRDPRYLSHTHGCPIVSANPDTLESALERLIRSHALRDELGRQGRAYVEREWSYEALAPDYAALHSKVWDDNRLWQTLVRRRKSSSQRENPIRVPAS